MYLTGSFVNTPTLRTPVAFVPADAPHATTECLLHLQSAAALTTAHGLAAVRCAEKAGFWAGGASVFGGDADGTVLRVTAAAAESPQHAEQQVRVHERFFVFWG